VWRSFPVRNTFGAGMYFPSSSAQALDFFQRRRPANTSGSVASVISPRLISEIHDWKAVSTRTGLGYSAIHSWNASTKCGFVETFGGGAEAGSGVSVGSKGGWTGADFRARASADFFPPVLDLRLHSACFRRSSSSRSLRAALLRPGTSHGSSRDCGRPNLSQGAIEARVLHRYRATRNPAPAMR